MKNARLRMRLDSVIVCSLAILALNGCSSQETQVATSNLLATPSQTSTRIIPTATPSATSTPTTTSSTAEVWENAEVNGSFSNDQVWKGEIHIIGDVVIEGGATLTIEPGTLILIDADNDVDNLITFEPWLASGLNINDYADGGVMVGEPFRDEGNKISIMIWGTLNAIGQPEEPIVFSSDSPHPGPFDWNQLFFRNGILSHSIVEYHRILGVCNGVASFNTIRNSGEQGIGTGGDCSPVFEFNNVSFAGHELINVGDGNASPIIRGNILGPSPFGNNGVGTGGIGIAVHSGSPQIYNNVISGNHLGIVLMRPDEGSALVEDNLFLHNTTDFVSCASYLLDEFPECPSQ